MKSRIDPIQKKEPTQGHSNKPKVSSSVPATRTFIDNRPEALVQRKIQEKADNSPQAKQAKQIQQLANGYSTGVIQRIGYETWGKDKWVNWLGNAWVDEKAGILWGKITNMYSVIQEKTASIETKANEIERTKLSELEGQIKEINSTKIARSEGHKTLEKLSNLNNKLDSLNNKIEQRIEKEKQEANANKQKEIAESEEITAGPSDPVESEKPLSRREKEKQEKAERRAQEKEKEDKRIKAAQAKAKADAQQKQKDDAAAAVKAQAEALKISNAWDTYETDWNLLVNAEFASMPPTLKYNWQNDFTEYFNDVSLERKADKKPSQSADKVFNRVQPKWVEKYEDNERCYEINNHVKDFITKKLNKEQAQKIGFSGKNRGTSSDDIEKELKQALKDQLKPNIIKWRTYLGMDVYKIIPAGFHNSLKMHITFDKNSLEQPGSIKGKNKNEVTDSLLMVSQDYRIHATLEANEIKDNDGSKWKNPHVYWGGHEITQYGGINRYSGNWANAKADLQSALDDYVDKHIRPLVQTAIDNKGDI